MDDKEEMNKLTIHSLGSDVIDVIESCVSSNNITTNQSTRF